MLLWKVRTCCGFGSHWNWWVEEPCVSYIEPKDPDPSKLDHSGKPTCGEWGAIQEVRGLMSRDDMERLRPVVECAACRLRRRDPNLPRRYRELLRPSGQGGAT